MEYVRTLRERRNLTQAELAQECGCHATTISQIESARMLPSLELFARLARVLKAPPKTLLEALLTASQLPRRAPGSVTDLQKERERRKREPHADH